MEFLQGEVLVSSAFHKLLKISGGGSSLAASTEWIRIFIGVYRCGITETIDGLTLLSFHARTKMRSSNSNPLHANRIHFSFCHFVLRCLYGSSKQFHYG